MRAVISLGTNAHRLASASQRLRRSWNSRVTRGIGCYLELKSRAGQGLEGKVIRAVRAAKMSSRTVIISFHSAILRIVRDLDASIMTGLIVAKPTARSIALAQRIGARQFLPRGDRVTPALLAKAQDAGLGVVAWTVNDPASMRRLIAAGVQGIITNYPDRLVPLLSSR